MKQEHPIRIDLTPDQQHVIKTASGRMIDAVELRVDELEDRIAPIACANGSHLSEVIVTVR